MRLRLFFIIAFISSALSSSERFNYSCELEKPEQGKSTTQFNWSSTPLQMTFINKLNDTAVHAHNTTFLSTAAKKKSEAILCDERDFTLRWLKVSVFIQRKLQKRLSKQRMKVSWSHCDSVNFRLVLVSFARIRGLNSQRHSSYRSNFNILQWARHSS